MKGRKDILLSFHLKWHKFLHVFEQLFVQNFQSGRIVMPQSDLRFPSSENKTKQKLGIKLSRKVFYLLCIQLHYQPFLYSKGRLNETEFFYRTENSKLS
jgi:hypothetical protein